MQFPATSSKCISLNGAEFEVARHVLQLGVDCGEAVADPDLPEDGTFFFNDLYVECHEDGNFANLDSTGDFGDRYSCGQIQIFLDSDVASPKQVLAFSMTTDSDWLNDADSVCYKLGPTTVGTTPTASATTPSSAPQATAIAPVTVNGPTAGDNDDASKAQQAPLGLIVGVSVGAVLVLAIAVVVLVVLLCRKSPTAREAQQQQKKDSSRVKDATSSERDINDASHQTARYHSGQGGGGFDDHHHQGQYIGHEAPYATVQVLPAEAIIDIPSSAWTDRGGVLPKSLRQSPNDHDVPHGGCGAGNNRGASDGVVVGDGVVGDVDGKGDGPCTSSPGQQQHNVAVTFKDQAQSVVVDGHPMAGNSIFAPRMMAEERNSATFSSSVLSDAANTRGSSSDPSGIYPPSDNGRRAAAASVGRYYDV
jgi:hypothetical protein